jgi:hypothetical protein
MIYIMTKLIIEYILESIPVHASLLDTIWMPDLIFTNEKSSRFHNITTENRLVRLSKNGDVYTSTRISLVMSSQMRLENFPMDSQSLYMQDEMENFLYVKAI